MNDEGNCITGKRGYKVDIFYWSCAISAIFTFFMTKSLSFGSMVTGYFIIGYGFLEYFFPFKETIQFDDKTISHKKHFMMILNRIENRIISILYVKRIIVRKYRTAFVRNPPRVSFKIILKTGSPLIALFDYDIVELDRFLSTLIISMDEREILITVKPDIKQYFTSF